MLHIILLILKIILWIILGILGLVLLLLLTILFAPIQYKVKAEVHENITVKAKVRFLIVSVKLMFDKNTKAFENEIRICGIKFGKKKNNNRENVKTSKGKKKAETEEFTEEDYLDIAEEVTKDLSADAEKEKMKPESSEKIPEFDLMDNNQEKLDEDVSREEQKFFTRLKIFFEKVFEKLKMIYAKLQNYTPEKIGERIENKKQKINKTITKLKKFWNLSCTVKTRAYLKKYLISLCKHIGPKKVKGHIRYGFKEPYQTGMYTGYFALLPFMHQKKLVLEPDFNNQVIEGDVLFKGHFCLGYILRIVLNINIWRTLKVAKKLVFKKDAQKA